MLKLLFLPLVFVFPSFIDSAIAPPSAYVNHYLGTKALWDAKMGLYTPDELNSFVQATFLGTLGEAKLCKALSAISLLECGPKRPVRDKTGHLGGHRETIRRGAKEAGIKEKFVYRNLKRFSPYNRTLSLSRHFSILYAHYNGDLEKTCRIWNQGPKWKTKKATSYYHGVLAFSKIYDKVN